MSPVVNLGDVPVFGRQAVKNPLAGERSEPANTMVLAGRVLSVASADARLPESHALAIVTRAMESGGHALTFEKCYFT